MRQGTLSPLLGIGVCVSIQFGVLEACKRNFSAQNRASGTGGPDGRFLSSKQLMVAGALAGVSNGIVSGPVEHLRIRKFIHTTDYLSSRVSRSDGSFSSGLQTQSATHPIYSGPFDAVKKIATQHGVSGIFKGQTATFMREGVGFAAYFLAYEKLMQHEMKSKGIARDQIPASKTVLFGAAAGYAVSDQNETGTFG
jgi:solute carrier family 25 (mitochondrial carnitine/acylcarnitine transporter), member 20/29